VIWEYRHLSASSNDPNCAPDEHLVAQFKAGEEWAFDCIVDRYRERVFRVAYRLLLYFDAADDIAQETFIRAYNKLKRFRGGIST
tara:strand:- start:2546 stop:2800 length:255 start_codon:yes stop_codon:yes gene_type:complete